MNPNAIAFFFGFILGFLIAVFILQDFYKKCLKRGIDEMVEQYNRKLRKIKDNQNV